MDAIDLEWNVGMATFRAAIAAHLSQFDELSKLNTQRGMQGLPPLSMVEAKDIAIQGQMDNDPTAFIPVFPSPLTIVVATYFDELPMATEISWPLSRNNISSPSLRWWGSGSTAVSRLVLGFDVPKLHAKAAEERKIGGNAPATPPAPGQLPTTESVLAYSQTMQNEFQMGIPLNAIPLQDAVEFAEYLGNVACGFDRFSIGPAGVGGPLDVLVLLPNRRSWVRRKEIHSSLK